MTDIDRVEWHKGREKTPVGLGDRVAGQVVLVGQDVLEPVEGGEECIDRLRVGRLTGGEAGPVDAIVDIRAISVDSLLTIVARRLSHRTDTETRPV
jgi:hypothetical protein